MFNPMTILLIIILFIYGAVFGSFACCQVWRIRKGDKSKRSHCMHCKYQLKWYDNIPVISWLSLGGKCRKCRKKIGCAEILAEVGLSLVFVLSVMFWPQFDAFLEPNIFEIVKAVIFLTELVVFTVLFIYDARWKELPTKLLHGASGLGLAFCGVNLLQAVMAGSFVPDMLWGVGGSLLILPGIYYLMYKVSGETWVGGGDWILCIPLALMLGNIWLAIFALFAANIIGTLVMLPIMLIKKSREMIPFGPFLILGFWVVFLLQNIILSLVVY